MHRTFGEDGTIQGLLDLAGLPFVGAACWDRDWNGQGRSKRLLQVAKIPVVPWITVHRADGKKHRRNQRSIERKFKYPVL